MKAATCTCTTPARLGDRSRPTRHRIWIERPAGRRLVGERGEHQRAGELFTGEIRSETATTQQGVDQGAVGNVVVDVALTGVDDTYQEVPLGSVTEETEATGEGVQVPYSFEIDDSLHETEFSSFTLQVGRPRSFRTVDQQR
jgi:hypothetical protein